MLDLSSSITTLNGQAICWIKSLEEKASHTLCWFAAWKLMSLDWLAFPSPFPFPLSLSALFFIFSPTNNFYCQSLCMPSDTDATEKYSWMWTWLNILCATLYFFFFTVPYLYHRGMYLHTHKHAHILHPLISWFLLMLFTVSSIRHFPRILF